MKNNSKRTPEEVLALHAALDGALTMLDAAVAYGADLAFEPEDIGLTHINVEEFEALEPRD